MSATPQEFIQLKSAVGAFQGSPFSSPNQPGVNPLLLGAVIFNTEETPHEIAIGLETRMTVIDLVGGGRVVDTYGVQASEISWEGTIWGPNVTTRVAALRAMQVGQTEVLFSWVSERYYVIVKTFTPRFRAVDCDYTITLVVTRDANGAFTSALPQSIDTQVSTLAQNAGTAAATVATLEDQAAPASTTDSAVSTAKNVPNATGPSVTALQTAVRQVQQTLQVAGPIAQLAGVNLTGVNTVVQTGLQVAKAYVTATPDGATKKVQAQQIVTALNLISRNVVEGQSARVIQVIGGTLAEISAHYYGTPDYATQLAAVNGINGLRLAPGIISKITLPPYLPALSKVS